MQTEPWEGSEVGVNMVITPGVSTFWRRVCARTGEDSACGLRKKTIFKAWTEFSSPRLPPTAVLV